MRLQVQELTTNINAVTFNQKYAGITNDFPTGSSGYSNCTGLCIWNRVGNVGILAHIEAAPNYPVVFNDVCNLLLAKINSNGGDKGSFSIVIFGSAATAQYSQSFENSLYETFGQNMRLNPLDLMDMRNGNSRGLIGKAAPINRNIFYGAGALNPATETFYLDAIGSNIINTPNTDVEIFQIQP